VDLERARIGGPLNCEGAILCNPGGCAINAHQAQITAGVFLRALPMANLRLPCEVTGEVRLIVARITGPVGFDGATLTNGGGSALNAERAEITGGLYLSGDGVNRAASLSRTRNLPIEHRRMALSVISTAQTGQMIDRGRSASRLAGRLGRCMIIDVHSGASAQRHEGMLWPPGS
jgi:hypothetical protein